MNSGKIIEALAERGQTKSHALQPVEEVLPKLALGDHLLEVLVGRGDDAHVDADRLDAADPLDLALLERAQDLHLHAERHVADLVEEERAFLGELETSGTRPDGAGEGAALVAEQLGFEQTFGDRGGVDGDQRAILARAQPVDGARQDLLARAALALDQDGQVGRRRARATSSTRRSDSDWPITSSKPAALSSPRAP